MKSRALIVVTFCAAAIAGCSSSSSPEPVPTSTALSGTAYSLALNAISVSEDRAHHEVEAAFHAKTVAKVQTLLSTFADDQASAAQRLVALLPPADAATAHLHLVQAFNLNATAIRSLVNRLADVKTVKQALAIVERDETASRAGDQIDAALKELKKLGYT